MIGTASRQQPRLGAIESADEAAIQPQGKDGAGQMSRASGADIAKPRLIHRADQIAIAENSGPEGQDIEDPRQLAAIEPLPV